MMYTLFILLQILNTVCSAQQKPYESYDEIVDRLSKYRQKQVTQELSTSVPQEHFQFMVGLMNTSTSLSAGHIGTISQNGFGLGVAKPLISQQLFLEVFGKWFQDANNPNVKAQLQQYEVRMSHKERLSFAVLNLGLGASARFLSVQTSSLSNDYRIPSLMGTIGLERRLATRLSVAGDLAYHRSLRNDNNGKNTAEFMLRLNYHL